MSGSLLRTEAVEQLARARGTMLSVVTMQPIPVWRVLDQEDDRNINVIGCMGAASSLGLGLAIAQPSERVLVIDGDGSLLMQLGSLVSIAEHQPANLYHAVFENGVYHTSGGQPLPAHGRADLCEVALAAGYREARRFTSVAEIEAGLDDALSLRGPVLLSFVITGQGQLEPSEKAAPRSDFAAQAQMLRTALVPSA